MTMIGNTGATRISVLQQESALQVAAFGEQTRQALYGDDLAITRYHLAVQQIQHMNGLSVDQKQEQLV